MLSLIAALMFSLITLSNGDCCPFNTYCCKNRIIKQVACYRPPVLLEFPPYPMPQNPEIFTSAMLEKNCPISWNEERFRDNFTNIRYILFRKDYCGDICIEPPKTRKMVLSGICLKSNRTLMTKMTPQLSTSISSKGSTPPLTTPPATSRSTTR